VLATSVIAIPCAPVLAGCPSRIVFQSSVFP
jgi:hypothetical protein